MDRVKRIAAILTYMADAKVPCRVGEISQRLDIDKSSTSRILKSLQELQWVKQLPSDEFTLGDKLLGLGLSFLSGMEIRRVSLNYLHELNNLTKETVSLVLRIGLEDMCVEQVPSPNSLRHVISLGKRDPIWAGSPGKVILANLDEKELEEIFFTLRKSGDLIMASGQRQDLEKLKLELPIIKRQGYSTTHGERDPLIASISAPIFEHNKVIGTITVTGPVPRFNEQIAENYRDAVTQAARNISMRMGSY